MISDISAVHELPVASCGNGTGNDILSPPVAGTTIVATTFPQDTARKFTDTAASELFEPVTNIKSK